MAAVKLNNHVPELRVIILYCLCFLEYLSFVHPIKQMFYQFIREFCKVLQIKYSFPFLLFLIIPKNKIFISKCKQYFEYFLLHS